MKSPRTDVLTVRMNIGDSMWQSHWVYGCFKTLFISLLFLLFAQHVYCQPKSLNETLQYFNDAKKLFILDNPTQASDEKALKYFLWVANSHLPQINSSSKIESLIKAGNIHQGYGRYKESQDLYHQALAENKRNPDPALEYEAYLYLGSSLYFNGILDSAKLYFEYSDEIANANRKKLFLPEQDRLYNSLGAIYYEGANYKQAKNYFELALELASPRKGDYNEYYATLKSNIANCLLRTNNFDSAIQIFRSLNPAPPLKSIIRQNLAHAYFEKGVYDSALNIYKSTELAGGLYKAVALNDIGRIYMTKGKYALANLYFDSALIQNNKVAGNLNNREGALSFLYKAELAQKQSKTDEALLFCNKALSEVHLNFSPAKELDIPADISNSRSPITLYKILVFKAGLIYKKYLHKKEAALLKASLITYVKAIETSNFISNNFDNDDAKIFFLGNSKAYYERAMQVGYESCQKDPSSRQLVLYILESYKGSVLRQNLEYSRLISRAGIPDSIIKKENELKSLYAVYLTKLNLATNETESNQIQKRLRRVMVQLSGMHRTLEKYESYYRIRQNMEDINIPIKKIQHAIGKDLALLNYFTTDSAVFIFVLTHNDVKIERVKLTANFKAAVTKYLSESLRISEGERYTGYAASNTIFKTLLEPIYPEISNYENIVIIPDAYLFYIPFDALTKTPGKKDYLVYSHAINFHYSFSLFLEKLEWKVPTGTMDSTLAFAPFSGTSGQNTYPGYLSLPYSLEEIDNPNSRKYIGSAATRKQFFRSYNQYNILHLATHANLGKDSSSNWIQFYPDSNSQTSGRLYLHEIYNMQLSVHELVILSACESGSGLTIGGEGLLSISRAFMYAGANGIISTLYKTDDRVTAFLMKRLFVYLQKGIPPEQALRKSKIDLLESGEINLRVKSPNYWGNFIYVGKVTPQKNSVWKPVMLISALSLVIFYFVRKRKLK